MAYRRCLLIRGKLIDQKCHPSLSYLFHSDERICECPDEKLPAAEVGHLLQRRSFGSSINVSPGFAASSQLAINSNSFLVPCSGYSFCQYMSTINQGSNNIEFTSDVANVLTDKTLEAIASQAPILNEVAIASADSFLPVQALQYFIDYVHTYTGLNWWAAITLTTLLIRGATLPLLINQLKATSKLTLMRPHLEDIKQEMQDKAMDPMAVAEGQKKMKKLFNEYGVSPFTPLKGLFIQGPIFVSFFLAIRNMAEKMPSFKNGGAYWFLDLSTPDSLYILPILTALSFLITVECNMQEGMEGNPVAGTMKNVSRGLAVLTVPFTMAFPKAIFCYWVTSNLFSLVYGLGLKVPGVKKALGVPEIPAAAPTNTPQSPFSFFPALKKGSSATTESSSAPVVQSKLPGQKISSSSVISQRLRSLEKQVKGRKKNKKL
ncbi:mitochondrial inner membrane protein OXA1-like isoform X2 [Prosopis cineraria]|uniref:mitochondrial inner membrane protein OXA1-like isoform X2 n=1 Tax=Prosopis cineraria TaxID=364024 RepID=UPI00240ECA0D|nr:mitochondrial inner membrane protein OXA1-like isoform X2 [Prosopis cineraria]